MRIYFDHNASTPLHPEVLQIQNELSSHSFANPSSLYAEGRFARQVIESARAEVACLLGAEKEEIVFTSGGTEGNNTVLLGVCQDIESSRSTQIISSQMEHPSVLACLRMLEKRGFRIQWLSVDSMGCLNLEELENALGSHPTRLVTLSFCNHEIGNIHPIEKIAELSHKYGALFHCDATQAVGRIPMDLSQLAVDFVTMSSHKIYGPKGVGALYYRRSLDENLVSPLLYGGSQERGRRAGTENTVAIAGFGKACELSFTEMESRRRTTEMLRDRLETALLQIPGSRVHGDRMSRAPGTCHMGFEGVDGELLMASLDLKGVSVSVGSACSSGTSEPSKILLLLGFSARQAKEGIRFSLGYENTKEQVDEVIKCVTEIVHRIRRLKEEGIVPHSSFRT